MAIFDLGMSAVTGRKTVIADVFVNVIEHVHGAETQARVTAIGFVKPVMMIRDPDLTIFGLLPGIVGMPDKRAFHMIVQPTPGNRYGMRTLFNIKQTVVGIHGYSHADFAVELALVNPNMVRSVNGQVIIRVIDFMDRHFLNDYIYIVNDINPYVLQVFAACADNCKISSMFNG
jgi:hypothetical protein